MKMILAAAIACSAILLGLGKSVHAGQASQSPGKILLSDAEVAEIISHGPWPPPPRNDPSNRVSGNQSAIALGELLFFDPRLSANDQIACSTCHDPRLGWTDGRDVAGGLERLDRNTQSLFNVSGNRWFGWDGRNDSLWAHSIGPILDDREMGATPEKVAAVIRSDKTLNQHYTNAFGTEPVGQIAMNVVVDAAKSIAAFQETIVSGRTTFDAFRDALARGDTNAAANFPAALQRGAALFVGRGKCNLCHLGARFTNDEFDDAGVPYFTGPGRVDRGRHEGIKKLRTSPFNLLGSYNDANGQASGWATRQVAETHRTFGQFRVPSLRQLTHTAPYMHNGSLRTLRAVIDHYSNISLERIHADGALILEPMNLSDQESTDLLEFLRSLSTPVPGQ